MSFIFAAILIIGLAWYLIWLINKRYEPGGCAIGLEALILLGIIVGVIGSACGDGRHESNPAQAVIDDCRRIGGRPEVVSDKVDDRAIHINNLVIYCWIDGHLVYPNKPSEAPPHSYWSTP